MALYDYSCRECDHTYIDVRQDIGSDPIPRCPQGHRWERIFGGAKVRIAPGFTGRASISPQMEVLHATGDPNLAFGPGKKDPDRITLDDIPASYWRDLERGKAPDH